jgi:hypothetical protein
VYIELYISAVVPNQPGFGDFSEYPDFSIMDVTFENEVG